jgi:hypothetical protein
LLKVHAARLASPARARANHEIVRPRFNRRDEPTHQLRAIAPVAVHKNYDLALVCDRACARQTRAPVAASRLGDDARARLARTLRRAVVAPVINHDHLRRDLTRHGAHDRPNRLLLVQSGDDDGDACGRV